MTNKQNDLLGRIENALAEVKTTDQSKLDFLTGALGALRHNDLALCKHKIDFAARVLPPAARVGPEWVVSRSQGGKPRTTEVHIGRFVLRVHRHINYPAYRWLASCEGVFFHRELKNEVLKDAQREAAGILRDVVDTVLIDIERLP